MCESEIKPNIKVNYEMKPQHLSKTYMHFMIVTFNESLPIHNNNLIGFHYTHYAN